MKWLLWILGTVVGIVVVAIVVLFAMGMRSDAGKINTAIEINRPPAEVWPWITDAAHQKRWVGWLVDIKPLNDKKGVGERSVWIMEDKYNNNQRMEIVGEVTEVSEGKSVAVKMMAPGMFSGLASYTLTDLGNGCTRMESRGQYHYDSTFARFMEPLITPQAAKKMNTDLAALKNLIEAERVAAPAVTK